MTARLPIPGDDETTWGILLNEYLGVSLNDDGTIQTAAITTAGGALTSGVVHNTGKESIGGAKTFVVSPTVPSPTLSTDAANKSFVESTVSAANATPLFTSSDSATIYVTTDGSDSNDGLTWDTAKATITGGITALPANGGIVQLGYGIFNVSSSGRTDTGVSYSSGTWTDSHITSGDVGSYVLGSGAAQGTTPKIVTVNAGVSFTTDVAPGGAVSSASVVIVNPAFVLPAGVRLKGMGSDTSFNSNVSTTQIYDSGTGGVTCLIRGNVADTTVRYGIYNLSLWGANTGTSTTLYGIYVGNNAWFCDFVGCDISYHGVADLAIDGNINNVNVTSCNFNQGGYAAATTPTGGILCHPYWQQPSAGLQVFNCFFQACYGFGICDGDPDGAYGIVVLDSQFNSMQATSVTNSGASMALQSHGDQNGQALVLGGWSESAANLDLVTTGNVTVYGLQMYSRTSYHWLVNGGQATAMGCYFGQATTASIHLTNGGNINWVGIHSDDATFFSGAPSPLPAFGSSNVSITVSSNVQGVLPIANGGTGSSTQNFIDLSSNQTIAGVKTFTNNTTIFANGQVQLQYNLPTNNGNPCIGGYYSGLGIGGSTTNQGFPIFGVTNRTQSSNGIGEVAFTVYDNNKAVTFNNTLDDGSGNVSVAGGVATHLVTKSSAYTASATDSTILASGTTTITLPTAVGITGRQYIIKNIGTNTVKVATAASTSQTIDGTNANASGGTPLALSTKYETVTVQSDGSNWWVINQVATSIL